MERSGKSEGPLEQQQIHHLLMDGEIAASSLIWRKGMKDWAPISQVAEFRDALQEIPPPLPRGARERPGPGGLAGTTLSTVPRPWARLFARVVDYLVFGLCLAEAAALVGIHDLVKKEFVLAMATVFLWIPVEAGLLSTWGYTPGKALLRIRVRKGLVDLPSFAESLRRSFLVWWSGEGMGFPAFFLFTAGRAQGNLKIKGDTSWDRDGRFTVFHESIERWRWVVLFLILGSGIALAIWARGDAGA
jgi:hypothetical protein